MNQYRAATTLRRQSASFVALASIFAATLAFAGPTPEDQCLKGLNAAAAKYEQCEQKLVAKHFGSPVVGYDYEPLDSITKCRVKYFETWTKLQANAAGTGSTCDNARYQDNGDGTVTDLLTALQWEKKTDDAGIHDKDNLYTWSAGGTAADGTAFTSLVATLNTGCFAGHCDWRLPTRAELQTILLDPCAAAPCIDPVFGPIDLSSQFYSATSYLEDPELAWEQGFLMASPPLFTTKDGPGALHVRAVRGGL
jgi:hypothetical protein